MHEDHYRINVATVTGTRTIAQQGSEFTYAHLFFAVVDGIGGQQEQKARTIAQELQTLYPTAKISITKWESRGYEVSR